MSYAIIDAGVMSSPRISLNTITIKGGTWTILAGQTSVDITHQLGDTPLWANATRGNDYAADCGVTAKTATTLTISIPAAQPADATGDWNCGK